MIKEFCSDLGKVRDLKTSEKSFLERAPRYPDELTQIKHSTIESIIENPQGEMKKSVTTKEKKRKNKSVRHNSSLLLDESAFANIKRP